MRLIKIQSKIQAIYLSQAFWLAITILSSLLLTSCKTVEVPIPAAYPLYKETAVLIETMTGSYGSSISHNIMGHIKLHVPNTQLYASMPVNQFTSTAMLVILRGNVAVLDIDQGEYTWGRFNDSNNLQYGTATRTGSIQVNISIVRANSNEILWAKSFRESYTARDNFNLPSKASIHESDGLQDAMEGKFKDAFEDVMRTQRLENAAEEKIPDIHQVRSHLLSRISVEIAQSFYDRIEKHLEFR